MKKILFLSALALGLMTSCSEDEYMPSSSLDANTIAFSTLPGASTRSGATITSLEKFTVDAVASDGEQYFDGTEFNFNSTLGVFQSTTPYYWPLTNSLSFYAISDPGTVSHDDQNVPQYSYEDWNGETDLVAATVLSGAKQIPYPLKFQHVLSQIYISAEAADKTEELTYQLVSVNMKTASDGTYSFADATNGIGTWEIDEKSSKSYSFEDALPLSFDQNGKVYPTSTYWNVLPVTDTPIIFKVCYKVFKNGQLIADFTGEKAKSCFIDNPSLISGKKYVYNFLLTRGTDDVITFTTTMQDWITGETTTLTPTILVSSIKLDRNELRIFTSQERPLAVNSILPDNAENKEYIWKSLNEEIATVSSEGMVKGITPGETEVIVMASDGSHSADTCKVHVTLLDNNGWYYVDLGLPSGTLWSTQNVGYFYKQGYPKDWKLYGDYFAYGEIEPKDSYSSDNYIFKPEVGNTMFTKYNSEDGLTTLEPEDDAVRASYGGAWKIPSKKEWDELWLNTKHNSFQSLNIQYANLTSNINGQSVSFPLKGVYRVDGGWTTGSSQMNYMIRLSDGYCPRTTTSMSSYDLTTVARYYGLPVRGCLVP